MRGVIIRGVGIRGVGIRGVGIREGWVGGRGKGVVLIGGRRRNILLYVEKGT